MNVYGTVSAKQPWQSREGKEELSKIYDAVRSQDFRTAITARGRGLGRGLVMDRAEKSIGLLRRYESELERGLYAAIAQIERLQASRPRMRRPWRWRRPANSPPAMGL